VKLAHAFAESTKSPTPPTGFTFGVDALDVAVADAIDAASHSGQFVNDAFPRAAFCIWIRFPIILGTKQNPKPRGIAGGSNEDRLVKVWPDYVLSGSLFCFVKSCNNLCDSRGKLSKQIDPGGCREFRERG
jgi:hypothetical protein